MQKMRRNFFCFFFWKQPTCAVRRLHLLLSLSSWKRRKNLKKKIEWLHWHRTMHNFVIVCYNVYNCTIRSINDSNRYAHYYDTHYRPEKKSKPKSLNWRREKSGSSKKKIIIIINDEIWIVCRWSMKSFMVFIL